MSWHKVRFAISQKRKAKKKKEEKEREKNKIFSFHASLGLRSSKRNIFPRTLSEGLHYADFTAFLLIRCSFFVFSWQWILQIKIPRYWTRLQIMIFGNSVNLVETWNTVYSKIIEQNEWNYAVMRWIKKIPETIGLNRYRRYWRFRIVDMRIERMRLNAFDLGNFVGNCNGVRDNYYYV